MTIRQIRISIFLAGAVAASAAAQDTSQKVTLSSPAATAKNLLAELTKATGIPFSTSPQTANEVLIVDATGAVLSDLMSRIAKAAGAEWQAEGQGFRLIRSQALHNQQERAYLEDRATRIKAEQAKILDELSKMPRTSPEETRRLVEEQRRQSEEMAAALKEGRPMPDLRGNAKLFTQNPANRLLMRLMAAFASSDLARLGTASRTVFSSSPTRVQRSLPPNSSGAISEFVRDYATWMAAMPPQPAPEPGRVMISPLSSFTPMQGGIGKVLVAATRSSFAPNIQFELIVADQAGNIVVRQFRNIQVFDGATPNRSPADPKAEQPAPKAGEKAIDLSQKAQEHAAFMNQAPSRGGVMVMAAPPSVPAGGEARSFAVRSTVEVQAFNAAGGGGRAPRLPVNSDWMQSLASPESTDPLSFAVSELYIGTARQQGRNLVACIPDNALIPLSTRSLQTTTPAHILEISKNNLELDVEEKDGWLVFTPKIPYLARINRVDRVELGRLLKGIQKDGRLSLDNISRYALSRTNPVPNPSLDGRYMSVLFPAHFSEFNQAVSNWRMHQIYATLSVDQRRTLINGGGISLGALSPNQANLVHSLIFDDMMGPMLMQQERPGAGRTAARSEMVYALEGGNSIRFGSSGGKLMEERTEFLPTGVPSSGALNASVSTQEAVYASNKSGSADPRFMDADSYGAYTGMIPNIVLTGANAPAIPSYDTFKPAQIQTIDFVFRLTPDSQLVRQLRDAWFPAGAAEVPYEQLPASFRQRAEAAAERMKNSKATINVGGAPTGVRPPQT